MGQRGWDKHLTADPKFSLVPVLLLLLPEYRGSATSSSEELSTSPLQWHSCDCIPSDLICTPSVLTMVHPWPSALFSNPSPSRLVPCQSSYGEPWEDKKAPLFPSSALSAAQLHPRSGSSQTLPGLGVFSELTPYRSSLTRQLSSSCPWPGGVELCPIGPQVPSVDTLIQYILLHPENPTYK